MIEHLKSSFKIVHRNPELVLFGLITPSALLMVLQLSLFSIEILLPLCIFFVIFYAYIYAGYEFMCFRIVSKQEKDYRKFLFGANKYFFPMLFVTLLNAPSFFVRLIYGKPHWIFSLGFGIITFPLVIAPLGIIVKDLTPFGSVIYSYKFFMGHFLKIIRFVFLVIPTLLIPSVVLSSVVEFFLTKRFYESHFYVSLYGSLFFDNVINAYVIVVGGLFLWALYLSWDKQDEKQTNTI